MLNFFRPAPVVPTARPVKRRRSNLVIAGGIAGQAVGLAARFLPFAIKSYGRYIMRGGLFGILANINHTPSPAERKAGVAAQPTLAKSALLAELFSVFTSKRSGKGGSYKSTLLKAGLQKALPVIALIVADMASRKRP